MNKVKHFPGRTTAGQQNTKHPTPEQVAKWMRHPREAQGRLQHHDQTCSHCDGTGYDPDIDEDCDDPALPEPCPNDCENGVHRWGSWYIDDVAQCDNCAVEKPVGRMFEADGYHNIEYVCFTCYVKTHQSICKCDSFEWAENALGLTKERE